MIITDNFSITRLFLNKTITVAVDKTNYFTVKAKTVKEFYEDNEWNGIYHLWTQNITEWKKMFKGLNLETGFDYIKTIIFDLGAYKQYRSLVDSMSKYLTEIIPDISINFSTKTILINSLNVTVEIWNYIVYLLKLIQGEKVTQPRTFSSEAEAEFYRKQMEYEQRIQEIRQKGNNANGDKEGLIKTCLYITYSFPSITLNYLFDQTMAQIYWLQKMAAGSVSYSFNEKAFAAGNVKKGKKLDFFIK